MRRTDARCADGEPWTRVVADYPYLHLKVRTWDGSCSEGDVKGSGDGAEGGA